MLMVVAERAIYHHLGTGERTADGGFCALVPLTPFLTFPYLVTIPSIRSSKLEDLSCFLRKESSRRTSKAQKSKFRLRHVVELKWKIFSQNEQRKNPCRQLSSTKRLGNMD